MFDAKSPWREKAEGAFHPSNNEWKAFSHLALGPLRRLWQKHLLTLVAAEFAELNDLVSQLWTDYPEGFYAHPGNNKSVPTKSYKGLIRYLTKYLSSPPIGVSKIVDYDGENVRYYYQSHRTKGRA